MSQQDLPAVASADGSKTDENVDSNRFSLNLDDFEKVDADQLQSAFPSSLADNEGGKANNSAAQFGLDNTQQDMSNILDYMGTSEPTVVGITGTIDDIPKTGQTMFHEEIDPFKSDFSVPGSTGISSDKLSETPNVIDDIIMDSDILKSKSSDVTDLLSSVPQSDSFADVPIVSKTVEQPSIQLDDPFHNENISIDAAKMIDDTVESLDEQFSSKKLVAEMSSSPPAFDSTNSSSQPAGSPTSSQLADSFKDYAYTTEQSNVLSEEKPLPREPIAPPREPTPPPRQPTPPPREPTPPPRQPTPPPREPTPPPRKPTPPPREPTPPPRQPTPPPREPTPPPRQPTPPPREPTPPPRQPTPPPREPTPPPKEIIKTKSTPKPSVSADLFAKKTHSSVNAKTAATLAVFDPSKFTVILKIGNIIVLLIEDISFTAF